MPPVPPWFPPSSYAYDRGGAGISKVVRPLHIKDDSCMCKEGGEVYNR